MTPRVDAELLRRAAAGEDQALDALFTTWGPVVLRWCRRLGGPRIDAEDAAQDVFERLLRKVGHARAAETFGGLVYTTCRGVLSQHRRAAWVRGWIGAWAVEPAANVPDDDVARSVQAVLDGMPFALSEVLVLCDLEGRDDAEVATLLAVPVGTLKSRLRRARARFADAARVGALAPVPSEPAHPRRST